MVSNTFYRDYVERMGVARRRAHACACLRLGALVNPRGHCVRTMLQLQPTKPGKARCSGLQGNRWTPWTPWTPERVCHVIGACMDFPATAPQWGRSAPPSPSDTLLPILRLAGVLARRVCCPVLARVLGSEWRIVRLSMVGC